MGEHKMVISLRPSIPYAGGITHGVSVHNSTPCINDTLYIRYIYMKAGESLYYNIETEEIEAKED